MEVSAIRSSDYVDGLDASFQARFEAARPRLIAACRAVVGSDDADDVVQETYLRARERIGQLRNPSAFEAWLVRIAFNEARTVARRRARFQVPLADFHVPAAKGQRDPGFLELVDALPLRERMAVVLFYGYGYGMADLATILGISRINARTVLFRARRRLRKALEDSDESA